MGIWSRRACLTLLGGIVAGPAAAALAGGKLQTVYIVAIVPPGTGKVFITGNDAALGPWNAAGAMMYRDGNRRIYSIEAREGFVFEYKFTLGSWGTEALGEDGKPMTANYRITVGAQQIYQHVVPGFQGKRR